MGVLSAPAMVFGTVRTLGSPVARLFSLMFVKANIVEGLVAVVHRSVDILRWTARHFGLKVNFKAGKCAAIIQLRGRDKQGYLRRWAAPAGGMGIEIETQNGEQDILRVVPAYKRLGCRQIANGNLARELA